MLVVIKVVDFDVVEDEGLATVLALVVLDTRLVVVIADVSVKGKVVSKLGLNDMVVTSFVEVGKVGLTEVLCGVVVSIVETRMSIMILICTISLMKNIHGAYNELLAVTSPSMIVLMTLSH